MTAAEDRNDMVPAQKKLEWVTPKISLMMAEVTDGKNTFNPNENLVLFTDLAGPS